MIWQENNVYKNSKSSMNYFENFVFVSEMAFPWDVNQTC